MTFSRPLINQAACVICLSHIIKFVIACYLLQATGGSGQYSWTSDVTTVATVNARGLLTTTTDTGMTEVKAHDLENPMHFGIAQVQPISIKAL